MYFYLITHVAWNRSTLTSLVLLCIVFDWPKMTVQYFMQSQSEMFYGQHIKIECAWSTLDGLRHDITTFISFKENCVSEIETIHLRLIFLCIFINIDFVKSIQKKSKPKLAHAIAFVSKLYLASSWCCSENFNKTFYSNYISPFDGWIESEKSAENTMRTSPNEYTVHDGLAVAQLHSFLSLTAFPHITNERNVHTAHNGRKKGDLFWCSCSKV